MPIKEKLGSSFFGFVEDGLKGTINPEKFGIKEKTKATIASILSEKVTDKIGISDEQIAPSGLVGRFFGPKTVVLAEIDLTSGQRNYAAKGIRHPTRFYRGRVTNFGSARRSIPCPTGTAEIGDATIMLADTDQELRALFAGEPPQGKIVRLLIGPEGQSYRLFQVAYTGEILKDGGVEFPPGLCQIKLRDITFAFFDEDIQPLLTVNNFAGGTGGQFGDTVIPTPAIRQNAKNQGGQFDEEEIFSPIIFGSVSAEGLTGQGAIKCAQISDTDFNICRHPIVHANVRVWRRLSGSDTFSEITSGFSIVQEIKTIDSREWTFTHVRFSSPVAAGTEVRVDCEGYTDDGTNTGTVVRNPSDMIRIFLVEFVGKEPNDIDLEAFTATAAALDAIDTGDPDETGYKADGVIDQQMTFGEAITRMIRSFLLHMFTNKKGKIAIKSVRDSDPNRPVLTDLQDIYVKSENHSLPSPLYNRINYNYNLLYTTQEFNNEEVLDNASSQTTIGTIEESPPVNLYFVRSPFTALDVANQFQSWTNLNSYRIQLSTPGHRNVPELELADLVGVTNYGGITQSGGYANQEFLICGYNFNLDTKELRIEGVTREAPVATTGGVSGVTAFNARFGPYYNGNGRWFALLLNRNDLTQMRAEGAVDWGTCWTVFDNANSPNFDEDIKSFDTEEDRQNPGLIHIVIQLADWSVYYARFNLNQGLWEDSGSLITGAVAGNTSSTWFASITLSRKSNIRSVFFEAERNTDPPAQLQEKRRNKESRFINGAWTTPAFVGHNFALTSRDGQLVGYRGSRVMAGQNDRLHYFYNVLGGSFTQATPDEYHRTMVDANTGVFTNEVKWYESSLSYFPGFAGRSHGQWEAIVNADGTVDIFTPMKNLSGLILKIRSADTMNSNPGGSGNFVEVTDGVILKEATATPFGTSYPSAVIQKSTLTAIPTTLHYIAVNQNGLSGPSHTTYKEIDTATLAPTPAKGGFFTDNPTTDQVEGGLHKRASHQFNFPANGSGMQSVGAQVININGVEYIAQLTYRNATTYYFIFNFQRLSNFPIANTFAVEDADALVSANVCT